jgi:twinkle protein
MADAQRGAAFLDAEAQRKPKLSSPRAHLEEVRALWRDGLPPGEKTGWPSVDQLYTVQPGQLTVLTGWPSSGKSEWLDALLVNLSRKGWKLAVFSFENQPVSLHISKMLEKLTGKPFGNGPTERMTQDDVTEYSDDLEQSFSFTDTTAGTLTAKEVIETATPWLAQYPEAKRGLVIDPWNELEHWRPSGLSETEYVSATLSYVRNWARRNQVHVWIVAHPQKIRREDGKLPIPRPDMISGSQHWWNKADCCVTVYRDFEKPDSPDVEIYVQKCRFKHIGRIGMATLRYSLVTGQYREMPRVVSQQRAPYAD